MTVELRQVAAPGARASSWKPYPAYKDSGVEWIGEIPIHWNVVGLTKYLESIVDYRGRTPPKVDSGVFLVTARNIKNGKIDYSLSEEYIDLEEYKKVMQRGLPSKGDVLFTTEAPLGEVANVDNEFIALAQRIIKFRANKNYLDNYFLKFWIMSYSFQSDLHRYATGSTALGIKASKLNYLKVVLPTLIEQFSIARFLDDRTRKIDSLIEKKQKMIELLKEERAAVINQAVTKGLDPRAPMRDSGIEWLGEVPEKWEVKRLKWISYINPVKSNSQFNKNSEDLVTFLPMEKVSEDGKIDIEIKKPIKDLWNGFTYFEENDIIVAKITPCFENGKGALIKNLGSKVGFGSTEFHVLRPKENIIKELLYYLTKSDIFMKLGEASMTGAAGQKRVTNSFLEDFSICYTKDMGEQKEIIKFIEFESAKIDSAVSIIEKELLLLQEYRTALISEVVTGKIDVREAI